MPTAQDEARGATLTLSSSTWETAALLKSIQFDAIVRQALETTHLATSNGRTFMPEDLPDYGSITIEFYHIDAIAPPFTAAETVTITYPLGSGQSGAATFACSGFCIEYTPGSPTGVGEMMMGSIKFKLTGQATFTAAT